VEADSSNPHFLHEIFKPENFSKDELELVLDQFESFNFKKNDHLIELGKTSDYYYFLEEGFLRSYTIDVDGNDITSKFFVPKDIVIDWHSYFLKKPSRETIQALTAGKCWKIKFSNFMKLFHIESFREVGRTRLVQNYFELKNHSIAIIAEHAKDRYLHLMQEEPLLVNSVPLKHIATYLGITDTSLSRIRNEVANENH